MKLTLLFTQLREGKCQLHHLLFYIALWNKQHGHIHTSINIGLVFMTTACLSKVIHINLWIQKLYHRLTHCIYVWVCRGDQTHNNQITANKTLDKVNFWHLISLDLNSLAPGKFELNFRDVIFKQIVLIDDWGISSEIAPTWKPQDRNDDKSTLVQVMAWCHQAKSHYLSQCWPSSLSPYGVTRPQWVILMWCWSDMTS